MSENNSLSDIDEIVELSYLYDFYGALLKDSHRQIFEDYIYNNLSLSEIANEREITRQGVYDTIKRCRKKLKEFENKLELIAKFEKTKEKLQQIEDIAKDTEPDIKKQINNLAKEIYDII